MATITDITTGVQTVTATGAVTPTTGLDISGVSGDFTLCLLVTQLTAAKTCRIQFEDTVNAFTASLPVWVEQFIGPFVADNIHPDLRVMKRKYQVPATGTNNAGVTNGKIRVNVTQLDSGGTLSLHAWIES